VGFSLRTRLLNHLDRLVSWFIPGQPGMEAGRLSGQRMFVYTCLIYLGVSQLFALTSAAIGYFIGVAVLCVGMALLFAGLFYFRATGNFRIAVHVFVANCTFVAVAGSSYFSGGLYSPVTPWFVLISVAAVQLMGYSRDALFWIAMCLLIPIVYGAASLQGYQFPMRYPPESETTFMMISIAALSIALVCTALAFEYNSQRALQQVLDSRREVEHLARLQERMAERGAVIRSMHDGVGSHITSAIRMLQSESAASPARNEVLITLRDALDRLKLSIDTFNQTPGDVTALLANMRYRLGPRFALMGVELQWDVELLPICKQLDAQAMNELQFMLFESLSNVLQHAQAQVLRVEGHHSGEGLPGRVHVRLVDDGRGFDVAAVRGSGLAAMRKRAAAIGAQLHITSQPGRTAVEIQIAV
jgi:signal transduction histidine kinase